MPKHSKGVGRFYFFMYDAWSLIINREMRAKKLISVGIFFLMSWGASQMMEWGLNYPKKNANFIKSQKESKM